MSRATQSFALRIYRRLAEAFPHEFKMVYGMDVITMGEDMVEEIAREHGVPGLFRLIFDIAIRVPVERPDRVGCLRVVVDVDVPHHRGRIDGGGSGGGDRDGRGRRQAEHQRTRPAAVQEARCSSCCGNGLDGRPPVPG